MLSIAKLFAVLNWASPPDNMLLAVMIVNYLLVLHSIVNPFLYCSHLFFKRHIAALFWPGRDRNKETTKQPIYETFQIIQTIWKWYSVATE